MSDVFHLGLTKNDLHGATIAIVPGDPNRVEKIAKLMDNPVYLASLREFTSWRAELNGKPIIICSTGIGGPSTSIAVEELAQLGIRTFLRIGTTGAIQKNINVGDVLITTGAVRLDGASLHFAPLEYPAVADFNCTNALKLLKQRGSQPMLVLPLLQIPFILVRSVTILIVVGLFVDFADRWKNGKRWE